MEEQAIEYDMTTLLTPDITVRQPALVRTTHLKANQPISGFMFTQDVKIDRALDKIRGLVEDLRIGPSDCNYHHINQCDNNFYTCRALRRREGRR